MIEVDLTLADIKLGDQASFCRVFSEQDMHTFAALSGNFNSLHTDDEYAGQTVFKKRIVYGMLAAITCSTLVGMYLPGKRCLCLKQTLSFNKPIYIDEEIKISGVVKAISQATGILSIDISITRDNIELINGLMMVKVL